MFIEMDNKDKVNIDEEKLLYDSVKVEKVYSVNYHGDGLWSGDEEVQGFLMEGKNKPLVIQRMTEKAKFNRPSRLVIHTEDGDVDQEDYFEAIPDKSKMKDYITHD
jgi:hypothetical protein